MPSVNKRLLFLGMLASIAVACSFPAFATPTSEDISSVSPVADTPIASSTTTPSQRKETCFPDEIYHPEEGLCYADTEDALLAFQDIMRETPQEDIEVYDEEEIPLDEEAFLVSYVIDNDALVSPIFEPVDDETLLAYQQDTQTQTAAWEYFADIIPPDEREELTYFAVLTDGKGGALAAVEPSMDDPSLWQLDLDIADTADTLDLTYTLIHEFGHLLTLNAEQVPPDMEIFEDPENDSLYEEKIAACTTYFPGEGCAAEDSYLYQFYETFWAEMYDEWLAIDSIEDDDEYYEAFDAFYARHQDEFVTDYAAMNPEEDIAESWTFFVIRPKPKGETIAEQKILFFYQFPELVALREEIASRAYSRLRRLQP